MCSIFARDSFLRGKEVGWMSVRGPPVCLAGAAALPDSHATPVGANIVLQQGSDLVAEFVTTRYASVALRTQGVPTGYQDPSQTAGLPQMHCYCSHHCQSHFCRMDTDAPCIHQSCHQHTSHICITYMQSRDVNKCRAMSRGSPVDKCATAH